MQFLVVGKVKMQFFILMSLVTLFFFFLEHPAVLSVLTVSFSPSE